MIVRVHPSSVGARAEAGARRPCKHDMRPSLKRQVARRLIGHLMLGERAPVGLAWLPPEGAARRRPVGDQWELQLRGRRGPSSCQSPVFDVMRAS